MTHLSDRGATAMASAKFLPAGYLPVLLAAAVLLAAVPWQLRWGTVADTSWIITMAERVLAGDRLYIDIIETNPPFTVWLYLPAVAAARWAGILPETAVHLYVYLLCVAGLGGAALIARRAGLRENAGLLLLLPAFMAVLTIFPANSFSQREHIGVALLLPLLVLAAWRAEPTLSRPSLTVAIFAGLGASVIVLVKPHYVLLVLAPAFYLAARQRSVKPLFFPEYLVSAAVCVVYLVAVLRLHPEFMGEMYPLLVDTYLRVSADPRAFFIYLVILLAWAFLMLRFAPASPARPLTIVLAITSAVAYLPLFHQAKGWAYHAYPAIALGIGALLCRVFASVPAQRPGPVPILLVMGFVAAAWVPYQHTQKPDRDLVAAIRSAVAQPSVGLIGSDIAAGHPLTRMVDGRWTSIYCSDWLAAFVTYLALVERHEGSVESAARYQAMAERLTDEKMEELVSAAPDLVVVQKEDELWRDRLSRHPDFSIFMSGYRLLAQNDKLEAWLRVDPETGS